MVTADVVIDTFDTAEFTAWPIAEPTGDGLLVLSGRMSPAEVGTATAVLFSFAGVSLEPIGEMHHRWDRHLAETGGLALPGGLRLRDTATGAEIVPGCCSGLEDWRDWEDVLRGRDDIWLGHDPDTTVEIAAGTVRLRNEVGGRHGPALDIRQDDLAVLLTSIHRRLQGFLDRVHEWAVEMSPGSANRLAEILDDGLAITGPLDVR